MSRVWSTLYSSFTSYIFWCKGNFLSLRVTWPKNIKIQHWEALIEKKAVQISGKFCRLQAHHHQLVFKHSSPSVHFHQVTKAALAATLDSITSSFFVVFVLGHTFCIHTVLEIASLISSDFAIQAFPTISIHFGQGLPLNFLPSTFDSYFLFVSRSPRNRFTCTNDL